MPILPLLLALTLPGPQAVAPDPAQPQSITQNLEPAHARPAFQVTGKGDQVYLCAQQKDGMQWILQGPAAILYDQTNQPVGKHGAGPQWTWNDGSAVSGKLVGRRPAPDAQADIPWLLLQTTSIPGPTDLLDKPLKFDDITYVQRSNTRGGIAPTAGCDAANIGESKAVPYSATYTFYIRADK